MISLSVITSADGSVSGGKEPIGGYNSGSSNREVAEPETLVETRVGPTLPVGRAGHVVCRELAD